MPFYTTVFSQQSPSSIYCIEEDKIILIPAGPFRKDYGNGGSRLYDSINFYSDSRTKEDHVKLLKRFCIIYSFLFLDEPVFMFDSGELTNHVEVASHNLVPVNYDFGRDKVDFENVIEKVYFMNNPKGKVSFKELYTSTKDDFLNFFILFLDPIGKRMNVINYSTDYLLFNRTYLRIVNYITLLEIIIGHDEDCSEIIVECKCCGKKGIRHRKSSENEWIKKYLSQAVQNPTLEKSYFEVISCAREIRHKTTHLGKLPTAKQLIQNTAFEEYDFDRSKKEYKDIDAALLSIKLSISEVTHFLMLFYFYGLKHFFPLQTLKVTSIGFKSS
jgi:hypothetical protein